MDAKTWLGLEYRFPTKQPTRPRADARARLHARERHRTRAHARGSGSTFTRHSLRLSVSRAIRRAEPAFRLTGGHIREGTRNETRVGHADFGASRSRRHRDLCACVAARGHRGTDTAPRRRLPRLVTAGVASAAMDRGRGQDPAAVGRLRRDSIGAGVWPPPRRSSSWRSWRWSSRRGRHLWLRRSRGRVRGVEDSRRPTPDPTFTSSPTTSRTSTRDNLVQSWSDHTGNGLSLSSFVAAPELVDGGNISTGALFNGHKAVRFGESGITGLSLPTSALQLSTSLEGMTVVAVMSTDDSRDATAPFLFDRGNVHLEGLGFTSRQPK